MTIVFDYDNDCIRIGTDKQIQNDSKEIIMFRKVNLNEIKPILIEIFNFQAGENDRDIHLLKQDDGTISIIEEY